MPDENDPRPNIRLTELDAIPIPTERAADRLDIAVTVRDHPAWPTRAFTVTFDWNNAAEKWVWAAELEDGPVLVSHQPAEYGTLYRFEEYITFIFGDISQQVEAVTPDTLGRAVELFAIPGPRSPGYEEWVGRQRHIG